MEVFGSSIACFCPDSRRAERANLRSFQWREGLFSPALFTGMNFRYFWDTVAGYWAFSWFISLRLDIGKLAWSRCSRCEFHFSENPSDVRLTGFRSDARKFTVWWSWRSSRWLGWWSCTASSHFHEKALSFAHSFFMDSLNLLLLVSLNEFFDW